MNASVALFLFLWFLQNRQVLSIDIFEGNFPRFQCIECEPTTCTEKFMDAYPESKMGFTGDQTSINKPDTYFYLFTPNNSVVAECMHLCPGILPNNTRYNWKAKTYFIVHGFTQSACNAAWMREMKCQLLLRGDCNVILVDWNWGDQVDIYDSERNVKIVGKQISILVNNIANQTNTTAENFHLIGHSLGAHVAGFAGKSIPGLGRITGLDPAGPGYLGVPPENRLARTDAQYVDVIHTNGGNCTVFYIGLPTPCGDADFYVNGGEYQKNCYIQNFFEFLKGNILQALVALYPPLCSHFQAIYYFIVSINPKGCYFIGYKADSYESFERGQKGNESAMMGLESKPESGQKNDQPNIYYLDTTWICPYCK